ncbi:MAG: N-6 DNA methylase [Nitrospirae bacterium]|nr:N-6 DNA methylase [Nitrospirota bacterium]
MSENPIEQYLTDMAEVHATRANAPETSFYPALERLLTHIGQKLNPKVRCVINLANQGAGLPDGGLFTSDQFRRKSHDTEGQDNLFLSQSPARGVIEAKALSADVGSVAVTEQVERYWKRYGMVLVTNFRSFALIGKGPAGQPCILESFSLSSSESEFWRLAAHPRKTATERGERMLEYLRRVLLHNAPLAQPKDVAAILASYAHDARLRIESADLPALKSLRQALEEALGLHFEGDKGEHFFRSTLIQTLFYGVFSAWVLWARRQDDMHVKKTFADAIREPSSPYGGAGLFDWRSAHWLLRVPMLRALFVQVADPDRLGALGLVEALDWTAAALNRVERAEFFSSFDEGHAVQYFYEPFLHAFDPELRKELGVWYTPDEIVRYQVERVDAVLRSELGLADGLADPNVVVLDPCCGTGAYLRAVLRRIAATLHDKGGDALIAHDLKKAAMERVFGFEILPAPFVIAHLQLGLELETLGAPLSDRSDPPERAGVYLTNALTGWEPPKERPKQITFPGFQEERDAAGKVKQEKPILVILGNPPYNSFAGVSPEEENGLVESYKKGLISEWGIKKFNLDELYVRFFRLAERRIAEKGGRGVVSFISNFSYLGDPSFVVMRSRFLAEFDSLWFDCMNGDSRETGKVTPEGKPDPSVFSTEWNRDGIRVGTAVGLLVKTGRQRNVDESPVVRFRHFWGAGKRAELLSSLDVKDFDAQYAVTSPSKENRLSFRPSDIGHYYLSWPKLDDLCSVKSDGLFEKRDGALIDIDRSALEARMKQYFDSSQEWADLKTVGHKLTVDAARFDARKARDKVLKSESFSDVQIRRYVVRPFDVRWCYYSPTRPLWNEPRPTLWKHSVTGNSCLVSRLKSGKTSKGSPLFFSTALVDGQVISVNPSAFPMRLILHGEKKATLPGLQEVDSITGNLSPTSRAYLSSLGFHDPDTDRETSELIWLHALAIGYSPSYLAENADGIRQDWPRIPLPQGKDELLASAILGRQIATLLDTEHPVSGVTSGKILDDLKGIAVFQRIDGKPANPETGDLDITAGWGHAGKGGVTMPGKGKLIDRGNGSYDIFLNENTCWCNVPKDVWEYTIGGYQVIKKWLSYREKTLLGRGLTPDEVRYVTEMARRIAALIALQPKLDDNYRMVTKAAYPWPKK